MRSHYNERYRRFSMRIEKAIMIGIAVCMIVLAAGELLIQYDPVRSVLIETERLEGVSGAP
ncbi:MULTISPECIES: hypothetical protein [Brevibacillus]|uniref:Uncharacterized protein n=1 Tax=Brevibacillus invocatus TaxID=173959 RepID=A0A3M8CHZ1_9BACL|nr:MULTISPECIES: hypothetical protein [Brevibacillus]MCM3077924.1 hypothetical protein [Brevibacillus invocatus]MCM3428002.1 hypothetical protein [Brevibacillus invocatus]MDH4615987.1 hypothetical protein [Brevibacillus sp. AY1]RNB75374.1 hypothetical protein EDM52_07250 [Brevibacillus invocatus]